jgi:hypothetical protein
MKNMKKIKSDKRMEREREREREENRGVFSRRH